MARIQSKPARRRHFEGWRRTPRPGKSVTKDYVVLKSKYMNLRDHCLSAHQRELFDISSNLNPCRDIVIHKDYVHGDMFNRQSHVYAAIIFQNGQVARNKSQRCTACQTRLDKGTSMIFPDCVRFKKPPLLSASCACANCKWHDKAESCSLAHSDDTHSESDKDYVPPSVVARSSSPSLGRRSLSPRKILGKPRTPKYVKEKPKSNNTNSRGDSKDVIVISSDESELEVKKESSDDDEGDSSNTEDNEDDSTWEGFDD